MSTEGSLTVCSCHYSETERQTWQDTYIICELASSATLHFSKDMWHVDIPHHNAY